MECVRHLSAGDSTKNRLDDMAVGTMCMVCFWTILWVMLAKQKGLLTYSISGRIRKVAKNHAFGLVFCEIMRKFARLCVRGKTSKGA